MNIQYLEMWQTNIEIIKIYQDVDNVFRLDRDTSTMWIYYDDASFSLISIVHFKTLVRKDIDLNEHERLLIQYYT